MQTIQQLATDPTLWWILLAFSAAVFVASLIAVPWIVVRLPADYFDHRRRHVARPDRSRGGYYLMLVAKNLAGVFFLLTGVSMLVLPGQGLLTILIGLSLVNFPGKYRLERSLVSRPWILRSLNWLRRRAGRPPFHLRERTSRHAATAKHGTADRRHETSDAR